MAKEQAAGFQQALSQSLNHCPVFNTKIHYSSYCRDLSTLNIPLSALLKLRRR
jgi:hypothetical protein